jgi:hypothetical protein
MIIDNDGGNSYVRDDSPRMYDFTVHYTNTGRVEHWYFIDGQVALIEDYGNPEDIKDRKQKRRTQTVAKQLDSLRSSEK